MLCRKIKQSRDSKAMFINAKDKLEFLDIKPMKKAGPSLSGFPSGTEVKNPPVNAGDVGLSPGLERSPGEGIGYPLQYSCLENPMDTGA